MLDLAPSLEHTIVERAEAAGMTPDQLLSKLIATDPAGASQAEYSNTRDRVLNLLYKWQAEYGLPVPPGGFKTLAELSAEWKAEDAKLTPEEIQKDREFWEQREREYDSRVPISI